MRFRLIPFAGERSLEDVCLPISAWGAFAWEPPRRELSLGAFACELGHQDRWIHTMEMWNWVPEAAGTPDQDAGEPRVPALETSSLRHSVRSPPAERGFFGFFRLLGF